MKNFMKKSQKGLTLVEMLIVIVIIGVFAATMLLNSGDSVASAKANKIIATMTLIKNAALSYYATNADDQPTARGFIDNSSKFLIDNIDNSYKNANGGRVMTVGGTNYGVYKVNNNSWYVDCNFINEPDRDAIRKKLLLLTSIAQLRYADKIDQPYDWTGDSNPQHGDPRNDKRYKLSIQIALPK